MWGWGVLVGILKNRAADAMKVNDPAKAKTAKVGSYGWYGS